MSTSRRISYVLPAPSSPTPLLTLPGVGNSTIGRTQPLLVQKDDEFDPGPNGGSAEDHPRHCLGVAALALDTTTKLAGKGGPEGILYTGGRDGLVAAWELGLKHRPRPAPRWSLEPGQKRVRWERLEEGAAWDDEDEEDYDSEEDDDAVIEEPRGRSLLNGGNSSDEEDALNGNDLAADGWIGVEPLGSSKKTRKPVKEIPFEDKWMLDRAQLDYRTPTSFRQSVQSHTDWVNDILLCNLNQTVITAASDRTIRAWNPHSPTESGSPVIVGVHMDYVKSLAFAHHPQTLYSGGLDHKILVWDIHSARPNSPVTKLVFPDTGSETSRGSVYALATNNTGSLVAAGSPERVVRIWDPRTGGGANGIDSVAKLVGHTDNIRAILMSEDGRYLLSGSSDCTIKLWSLAAQRCLHTFSHHTDSVWSLFSDQPNLERFFSGDRAGYLCVTDVEGCQADYSDGECLVLAREEMEDHREGTQGICQIVAMDEEFVWTASGSASVNCWRDVGRKSQRAGPIIVNSRKGGERGTPLLGNTSGQNTITPTSPNSHVVGDSLMARNKRLSLEGPLERVESRELKTVAFAPETTGGSRIDSPRRESKVLPVFETTGPSPVTPSSPFPPPPTSPTNGVPGQRRATLSGASVAGSVMSVESTNDGEPTMNGIPIASLICLGLPETPYMPNSGPIGANLYSASALSVPHGYAGSIGRYNPATSISSFHHARVPSQSSHTGAPHHVMTAVDIARRDFEDREIAEEAEPLRTSPEEVIQGNHGLIRATMLNDRVHVLTVDTSGKVSVWNIIRCECVGHFLSSDVDELIGEQSEATKSKLRRSGKQINPRETLEMVRERIEGESMTVTWCSVDTRIGSLTVHLEESRCFDAEVYADELGIEGEEYKEDQRLNLGKWILTNLFSGLIKAEAQDIAQYASSQAVITTPSSTTSSLPPSSGINRGSAAPSFIPIDSSNRRLRSFSSLSSAMSPGITGISLVGASTPAMTPAILPAMSSSLGQESNFKGLWSGSNPRDRALTAIPQSPATVPIATNSSAGYTPSPATAGQKSPRVDASGGKDYFSFRSSKGRDSKDPSPTRKSGEADSSQAGNQTSNPAATSAQTPGGGLMGRIKGFGGKSKKAPGFETMAAVAASPEEEEAKGPTISEEEAAQLRVLAAVRSHPFAPPTSSEAPPLPIPPNVALLISEESKDAGAWAVTYRSMVGRTEQDIEPLEMAAPGWMLDWLFSGRGRLKDPVKLCFILEPWYGGESKDRLPVMPANNSRLTANRVLRIRKILQYIYEKIEMQNIHHHKRTNSNTSALSKPTGLAIDIGHPPSSTLPFASIRKAGGAPSISSVGGLHDDSLERAEDVLEVLCGEVIVPIKMTLAAVRQFMWNGGGDVVLYYRLKSD